MSLIVHWRRFVIFAFWLSENHFHNHSQGHWNEGPCCYGHHTSGSVLWKPCDATFRQELGKTACDLHMQIFMYHMDTATAELRVPFSRHEQHGSRSRLFKQSSIPTMAPPIPLSDRPDCSMYEESYRSIAGLPDSEKDDFQSDLLDAEVVNSTLNEGMRNREDLEDFRSELALTTTSLELVRSNTDSTSLEQAAAFIHQRVLRSCDRCDKLFSGKHAKTNMQRHVRLKHVGRDYPCGACARGYARSDSRLKHWRTHHPELSQRNSSPRSLSSVMTNTSGISP